MNKWRLVPSHMNELIQHCMHLLESVNVGFGVDLWTRKPDCNHACTAFFASCRKLKDGTHWYSWASKNDRHRAKRDSIARAPREKRRGEATRIYTAGCMPHFCTHKTQQCWTQNAPHKWIKQLRALACFTILPYFFKALFCFSGGGYSSQHSDPVKKAGTVCTQNLGAVSRVVTLI